MTTTSKLTSEALEKANEVYDDALTFFASVNALQKPEINIEKLRQDATQASKEVSQHEIVLPAKSY